MDKRIEEYIEKANEINFLLRYIDDKYDGDVLIKLYRELTRIIIYGNQDDLITYAKKVYDLNIPVSKEDALGTRIKNFILLYINEVIEFKLNEK